MEKLGNGDELDIPIPLEKESLLKKYEIPIDHLDFKYVKDCDNGKELEQILHILQSGEEGFYPELLKCTEERLFEINPNSKRLRKQVKALNKNDIDKNEWNNLNTDVESWIKNINKSDQELLSFKNTKDDYSEIPIRDKHQINKKIKQKPERIKSMDYSQWEKLDVDAEMLKMDLEEEKIKKEQEKIMEEKEKLNTVVIKPDYLTEAELEHSALQEKNRGNEFFKSGDYEEALNYYTNSLNFKPCKNVYNNRAITYIKLNQSENAIDDCNEVLKIEAFNQKALLRKALALKNLKQYEKAADCLQKLIKTDPNNTVAQNMLRNISEKLPKTESKKTVRISIQEEKPKPKKYNKIENSEPYRKKSKNVLIPIPGTSGDNPPFYKIVNLDEEIENKYKKSCSKTDHPSDENVINLNELEKEYSKKNNNSINQNGFKENGFKYEEISNKQNINDKIEENAKGDVKIENENNNNYKNQNNASGEPCNFDKISPYEFIKYWHTIKNDKSLKFLEKILRSIDPSQLAKVIGNKLDGDMLGLILECLKRYFNKREDAVLLVNLLDQFTKLPRFKIVSMLLNHREKSIANDILKFASSCGQDISSDLINKLL